MNPYIFRLNRSAIFFLVVASLVFAPAATVAQGTKTATVTEQSVRKYMQALAGDEMRGRGSATADELAAAKYIAAQLKAMKIEPAGDNGDYLQTVKFKRRTRGTPADAAVVEATTTNVVGILRGSDPGARAIFRSIRPHRSKVLSPILNSK